MTVTVSKPALISREEISALKKPSGIKGEELLRSNTVSDAYTALNPVMFRNRIINGDMRIDQRNNGGTVSGHVTYPVDRFRVIKDTAAGTMTMNRSSTAPDRFNTSVVYTVGTAYTPSVGENNFFVQLIEGYQTADFGWGTAGAVPVTLSFWVRCSLAGYFGGSLRNGSSNKSFIFSYTITAPNVWEYKTITIPGCTDGTWDKTINNGVELVWGFSVGSNYSNAPGGWYTGNYISATNAKFISSTAGATWFMTGAQLEKGTVATPFEFRPYPVELQLCQRYTEVIRNGNNETLIGIGYCYNSNYNMINYPFKVTKRTEPSVSLVGTVGDIQMLTTAGSWQSSTSVAFTSNINATRIIGINASFTLGNACEMRIINTTSYVLASAEL